MKHHYRPVCRQPDIQLEHIAVRQSVSEGFDSVLRELLPAAAVRDSMAGSEPQRGILLLVQQQRILQQHVRC